MISEEIKHQIDSMDYESMLTLWRFAPVGHYLFKNEIGDYYSKVMHEKEKQLALGERVKVSKGIGWDKPF